MSPFNWYSETLLINRLMTEFFPMEVTLSLWIPYMHHISIPCGLKLLTSHRCHCSHPVQIHNSNHTHFLGQWSPLLLSEKRAPLLEMKAIQYMAMPGSPPFSCFLLTRERAREGGCPTRTVSNDPL